MPSRISKLWSTWASTERNLVLICSHSKSRDCSPVWTPFSKRGALLVRIKQGLVHPISRDEILRLYGPHSTIVHSFIMKNFHCGRVNILTIRLQSMQSSERFLLYRGLCRKRTETEIRYPKGETFLASGEFTSNHFLPRQLSIEICP